MKIKFTSLPILALILFLTNCKKDTGLKQAADVSWPDNQASLAIAAVVPNTVVTIAGTANSPGFINGAGKTAKFNYPAGIQLMNDGTLYIADLNNNAIRKITTDGNVTSLSLQAPPDIENLKPRFVGIDAAGKIHIICSNSVGDDSGTSFIYNADGSIAAEDGYTYTYLGPLAKDPYSDVFYFAEGVSIDKHVVSARGSIGTDPVSYNQSLLTESEHVRGEYLHGLFVGGNRIIYFATSGRLFKYTPGGITEQLYPALKPGAISCIILNRDSRTMYLAASGKIEKIEGGKLTILAGPNTATPDGRDGVGLKADVNAFALALGDHENSIYFSDTKTHTIRKLMLK